ncbi:antirepressor [Gordonia phage Phabuloso]|nr:antirepressor [Gordonia phage Phabuloso]
MSQHCTAELVAVTDDGRPTTTSLIIAVGTQVEHASVIKLIRNNLDDFEEFGTIGFEIQKSGGRPTEFAILNEEQATLLLTYMRNTDVVRQFKKDLVRAFWSMRRQPSTDVDLSDPLAVIEAESARVAKAVEIARGQQIRAEKAERKLAVEQKHRQAIEGGDGIDPTTFGKKYFSEVRKTDFDAHLYQHGYLIDQRGTRINANGEKRDGYDHRKPTAKGRQYFYAHDNGTYGGRRRFVPRVRPQQEIALRDALAAEGLPVNEHTSGLVLLSSSEMRELGA